MSGAVPATSVRPASATAEATPVAAAAPKKKKQRPRDKLKKGLKKVGKLAVKAGKMVGDAYTGGAVSRATAGMRGRGGGGASGATIATGATVDDDDDDDAPSGPSPMVLALGGIAALGVVVGVVLLARR